MTMRRLGEDGRRIKGRCESRTEAGWMEGDFCTYDAMMAHAKKGRHPARWRPRRAVDARDDHWKVLGGLGEEG